MEKQSQSTQEDETKIRYGTESYIIQEILLAL